MGRRVATALLGAALLATLTAPPATAAGSGWGNPFRLTPPYATDLTAVNLAVSSRGDGAAAFSVQDQDNPAASSPFIAIRAARGAVSSPFAVAGAQQVLDLAYDRSGLRLLTGSSETAKTCCSTVQSMALLHNGRFGRASTLIGKLAGTTVGSLTPLPSGRLLATVATDRGVWVAQSSPGGAFGPTHRLTAGSAMPWTVAATTDARGNTAVAWTETKGQQGEIAPTRVYVATGSESAAPGGSHPVVSLPAGHAVDEVALAPSAGGISAAWVESWFDRRGAYRAQTVVSDLAAGGRRQAFPIAGERASALVAAGDARGDQVLAWKSCGRSGSCSIRTAMRRGGGRFGGSRRLGAIDPGQEPQAALAAAGQGVVGWISSGHVLAAAVRPASGRVGPVRTVSSTDFATNLALMFGSSRSALAAWTQGTLAPDVVGAVYRP